MPTQNWYKSVEELEFEASNLETLINELKSPTLSDADRKVKENQAKHSAEKLQWQIDELNGKELIDAKLVEEKERAETVLKNYNDTVKLKSSIVDWNKLNKKDTSSKSKSTEITQTSTQSENQNTNETEEKKWFFWKAWEWIWEKWSAIPEWVKGTLWAVWISLAGTRIYKKLFWRKNKKEWWDWNKDKTPRWKKFLTRTWIAIGTVVWWVSIYKNWNRITSYVKEKLWKALNFEEAMYTVETEVINWINSDNNFWEFSAHFNGMSYDENTHEISSFWQKTKINKNNKSIEWMDDVQFASWEELFHAVNIVILQREN